MSTHTHIYIYILIKNSGPWYITLKKIETYNIVDLDTYSGYNT